VACIRERRSAYRVLVGKPEGKGPLRTSWPRVKYNIKMELFLKESFGITWADVSMKRGKWWGFCEDGTESLG